MTTWKTILSWAAYPVKLLYLGVVPEWSFVLVCLFGNSDKINIESKVYQKDKGIEFSINTQVKYAEDGSDNRNVTKEWKDIVDEESELVSIFLIAVYEVDSHLKELHSIKAWEDEWSSDENKGNKDSRNSANFANWLSHFWF